MSSNIVPYYSATPPPLDDTEHYTDNESDDEFGDFSSAPTNFNNSVNERPTSANNDSCLFRPIGSDDRFEDQHKDIQLPDSDYHDFSESEKQDVIRITSHSKNHSEISLKDMEDDFDSTCKMDPKVGNESEKACEKIPVHENHSFADCKNALNEDSDFEPFDDKHISTHQDSTVENGYKNNCLDGMPSEPPLSFYAASVNSSSENQNSNNEDRFEDANHSITNSPLPSDLEDKADTDAELVADVNLFRDEDFDDFETAQEPPVTEIGRQNSMEENSEEMDPDEFQSEGTTELFAPEKSISEASVHEPNKDEGEEQYFDESPKFATLQPDCDKTEVVDDDFEEFQFVSSDINSTSSSQADEPVVQTGEPVVQTDEPAVQTDEPAVQTDEPALQTYEPVPTVKPDDDDNDRNKLAAKQDCETKDVDYDDFEEFQFVSSDMNSTSATSGDDEATVAAAKPGDDVDNDDGDDGSWSAFGKETLTRESHDNDSWAAFADVRQSVSNSKLSENNAGSKIDLPGYSEFKSKAETPQNQLKNNVSHVFGTCYPLTENGQLLPLELLLDVISQPHELHPRNHHSKSSSIHLPSLGHSGGIETTPTDISIWNNLKMMDLTSAFSFQWQTSQISRNLFSAIHVDTASILVGHKKSQAPLFAPNLGLLEPRRAPAELQAPEKDHGFFTSNASTILDSSVTHQELPQLEFDWLESGLTNPLDATEKEKEFLEALEPDVNDSVKTLSLETMLAALPFVPSTTQTIQKSEDVSRKLSEEAIQVLSKLPDLSFMHAKVLMFPLKDIVN